MLFIVPMGCHNIYSITVLVMLFNSKVVSLTLEHDIIFIVCIAVMELLKFYFMVLSRLLRFSMGHYLQTACMASAFSIFGFWKYLEKNGYR